MKKMLLLMLASGGLLFVGCATAYSERESGMSLGMGIFLSSLVLGPIALIIGTKDRWNWKKIISWPFAGLIVIALGLLIYNTIKERPKVQASFWDISLGATESDVKFLKGAPDAVSKIKDKDTWEYVFKTGSGYFVTNEKTGEKAMVGWEEPLPSKQQFQSMGLHLPCRVQKWHSLVDRIFRTKQRVWPSHPRH